MSAVILWVQDDFEGPMNGMISYLGENLWFSRENVNSVQSQEERTYTLSRLSEESMRVVIRNHEAYCDKTGAPRNHGDSTRKKRGLTIVREEAKVPSYDAELRPLGRVLRYDHVILPSDVKGEVVTVIRESDINNYLVPHVIDVS